MSPSRPLATAACLGMLALLGACAQTPEKGKGAGLEIAPVYRVTHAAAISERRAAGISEQRAAAIAGRRAAAWMPVPSASGQSPAGELPAGTPMPAPVAPETPAVSRRGGWALVPVSPNVYELHADDERAGRSRAL
jgi:hypothetical protein